MFDKLVSPVLSYGCELWGFITGNALERVHLQFCKRVLGVKQCCQNYFIYGELGRMPLIVTRHYRILKYWLKVLRSNESKYIRRVYNMMLEDMGAFNRKQNWAGLVKQLLENLGFANVWINQDVGSEELFLAQVKTRLRDIFIQNWRTRLTNSSRADLYIHVTNMFEYKMYLNVITVEKFRMSLSRLRCSSHRLHIESGRWHKAVAIPRPHRTCFACEDIDNELHFVLVCPVYDELRKAYIPEYFYVNPSNFKFVELLNCDNTDIVVKFGMYVNKALLLRNDILYGKIINFSRILSRRLIPTVVDVCTLHLCVVGSLHDMYCCQGSGLCMLEGVYAYSDWDLD